MESTTKLCIVRLDNGLAPSFPLVSVDAFGYGDEPQELLSQQVAAVLAELQRAEMQAGELVEEHADAIMGFAARLLDRRRLDDPDLDAATRFRKIGGKTRTRRAPSISWARTGRTLCRLRREMG